MGRTREFDIDVATDVAMNLFWVRGYEATSLHALTAATGLSKSSFYQAFRSKQSLFERCLDYYSDRLEGSLNDTLDQTPSGMAFIRSVLTNVGDETRDTQSRRGCLIMNTASELGQTNERIAKFVLRGKRRMQRIFKTAVERAQSDGDISPNWDAEQLAEYLVACMSGLKTMVKAGNSKRSIIRISEVMLATVAEPPRQ